MVTDFEAGTINFEAMVPDFKSFFDCPYGIH
jgi:hypothetical protein